MFFSTGRVIASSFLVTASRALTELRLRRPSHHCRIWHLAWTGFQHLDLPNRVRPRLATQSRVAFVDDAPVRVFKAQDQSDHLIGMGHTEPKRSPHLDIRPRVDKPQTPETLGPTRPTGDSHGANSSAVPPPAPTPLGEFGRS